MSYQPSLKQLKYLCAISTHLHFGKAAEACHVSQSTLSAALLEMEQNLGVSLVERNNKRVLMTTLGRDIVERSQQLIADMEDLVDACNATRQPFSGEMRVGVIPTIAPYMLPSLLSCLRKEHPAFKLFIREDLSGHLLHSLEMGDLDVLLLALPYPAEAVETLHLFYDAFLLAYDAKHPIDKCKELHIEDLKGQDLLLLEDGHCLREHALDACRLKTTDVSIPYQATSLNTIVQMVANNIGMTLIPKMAVDKKLLSGTSVKTKTFVDKDVHRSIGLMWRKKSPRRQEFYLLGNFIKKISGV